MLQLYYISETSDKKYIAIAEDLIFQNDQSTEFDIVSLREWIDGFLYEDSE